MKQLATLLVLLLLGWLPRLAAAQPDLVVVPPYTLPGAVVAGGTYPLAAVIKNLGPGGSQFNCIGYYLSADNAWDGTDSYLGSSCQSLLLAGQSGTCGITATIPALTPAGSRYLLLVADPLNAEQETDETNNVVSFAVTITAGLPTLLPDLALWRPSLAFGAVPPGGSTGSFTFIQNNGPVAAAAYEIGFYLSADTVFSAATDIFLGQVAGSSLSANTMTIHSAPVLTVPVGTAPGPYYLVLMADPRNLVAESNEANNSRALPLRVTGTLATQADAAAAALAFYPNPVAQGAPLHLVGAGGSPPRLRVACYDATGRLVHQQTVGGPGGATRLDTGALPAGLYQLRISGEHVQATRRLQIE